ncbi:EAL domain-containing protein [Noviherbaspirillum sp. 17J57-3]|uniref:EAL domain-containing protein n=1 Tax=Noviherbaspirillum galbum TaxID=2709383 RepID=A0A6B3STQ7_9BURK|nr:EAL domain-containing protein [Noviherbaspirillum galbum]
METRPARGYLVSILVFAGFLLIQFTLQPMLDGNAPMSMLLIAVIFASIYAGGRAALLVTLLSLAVTPLVLLGPGSAFAASTPRGHAMLIAFAVLGLCISFLGGLFHDARIKAHELMITLDDREHTMRALLESTTQAVLGIGTDGRISIANKAVFNVFGYRPEELIGQSSAILVSNDEEPPADARGDPFTQHCITASMMGRELMGKRRNGEEFPMEASFSMAETRAGAMMVSYVADITERKLAAERLRLAAQHDHLTGLPNRALVYEMGDQLLSATRRSRNFAAVMFFDLDRFKPINDTYGHEAGDKMLQEVAARLQSTVRGSDLVGRIGGDEFVAILPNIPNQDDVLHAATHLLKRLGEPYRIDHLELRTSPSIGISIFPTDGGNLDTLIRNADAAMYHAKHRGRNTFQFFTAEINRQAEHTLAIEQRMRQSIEDKDFELWYQPIFNTTSMDVVGAEALLRWKQADSEPLPPGEFIAVAEASGLINQLGDWVLKEACMQLKRWRAQGLPSLFISVNVSPMQFRATDFQSRVRNLLAHADVDPSQLELEVTESTVMKQVEEASRTLAGLKKMGLRIALDDFGTGYSSLSYLSSLPIDKLKVDQSFIRHIDTDARSLAIAETVITLGKKLHVEVVAEGIESKKALQLLRERGCDLGQGYLISKPLREDHFMHWFQQSGNQQYLH